MPFSFIQPPSELEQLPRYLDATFRSLQGEFEIGVRPYYDIIPAERDSDLTLDDIDTFFVPGNVLRYGKNTTPGTTDMTTAIQIAFDVAEAMTLGSITDPYGTLNLGGAIVKLPDGKYLTTSGLEVAEGCGLRGVGRNSSIIISTHDGFILRNKESANFTTFGLLFEDFGIIGDRTKTSQVGLALLRSFNGQIKNIVVQQCGNDGIRDYQGLNNYYENIESQSNVGEGIHIREGITSWAVQTLNGLPSNKVIVHGFHFAFNDAAGIRFSGKVNGCSFISGSSEQNYDSSADNVGFNVHVTGSAFVPNEFVDMWCEGPVQTHVFQNSDGVGDVLRLTHFHHFSTGAAGNVDRAVIVDGGTCFIDKAYGQVALYKTIAGSNAPFRVNKAGGIATLRVKDARGSLITNNAFVEDETGATTGLHNQVRMENFGERYGLESSTVDFGVNGPKYRQSGQSFDWLEISNFFKGIQFGDGTAAVDSTLIRVATGILGMKAGDFFRDTTIAGITAFATGGQASATQLTSALNEISVCATDGDSVKMPTALAGLEVKVINNGAAACDVFPNTSDDLGTGVNTAVSLASGANITYSAYDTTNWVALT